MLFLKTQKRSYKLITLIILAIGINACSSLNDEEKKLVHELNEKYNCTVELLKDDKSLKVIYSNCDIKDDESRKVSINSLLITSKYLSNINEYSKVGIILPNDLYFESDVAELKMIDDLSIQYHQIFSELKNKNYEAVYNQLWSKIKIDTSLDDFISYIQTIENKSRFDTLEFYEFDYGDLTVENEKVSFVRLIGYFNRQKNQSSTFELYLPKTGERKIYGLFIQTS